MKGDIQDVKHELALLLASSQFTTVLTAIDAEKGVASPTPGPTAVHEGEKANTDAVGYPVCEVIGIRTLYGTVDQQTKEAMHEISIAWTQCGDDELTVTAQLERLVRATRDLFWPAGGAGILVALASQPIAIVSEEYSELLPARDQSFVKGSATVVHVITLTL